MITNCVSKHTALIKRCAAFLCIFIATITGCTKEGSSTTNAPHASLSLYAMVPDAPDLNVLLNGSNAAVGLGYGSYTLYSNVASGNVAMQAQSYSRNITVDTSLSLAVNNYYSLFLTGSASAIKPVLLRDSFPSSDTGYCGLRFLIFSPGISGIDFHILKSDSTLNQNGWANRSYDDTITLDSINIFKKYKPGTYSFFAIKANSKDTLARFTSRTFGDSSNYTLLLEGHFATGDTALQLGTRLH